MTPISEWLRATRLRQLMPGTEDPWTQDYFLALLAEETGWHLHRPSYSKYENGKQTPERDTLRKFVQFWEARGEPGPDLTPPKPAVPPDPLASVVAAIDRQTAVFSELLAELRASRQPLIDQSVRQAILDFERTGSENPRRTPDPVSHGAG